MGACVSTSNRTTKPRKYSLRSRKRKGKVSAAVSDAPKTLISNNTNHFAVREFVPVDIATTNRRKCEVSNLTVYLTKLQWHHSNINKNVLCQEELWFDSTSILDSDSVDDFISVHGDGFSSVTTAVGTQMRQYENASRIVDAMCKYEECGDSTPIALVVEEYFKRECKTDKYLTQDEEMAVDNSFDNITEANSAALTTDKVLEGSCDKFKILNEEGEKSEEKSLENTLKQMKSPCMPHLAPFVSFNDKVLQIPSASLQCLKRKSVAIRLSFKKRSCDGDETTEFCA